MNASGGRAEVSDIRRAEMHHIRITYVEVPLQIGLVSEDILCGSIIFGV